MNKKLVVFIINPKSGVERVKELKQLILSTLNLDDFQYEIWHTKYAKHGKELAKQAIEKNAAAVVAVGGTGVVETPRPRPPRPSRKPPRSPPRLPWPSPP